MKNPFLKRLIRESKSEIMHSSGYATAQNSTGMGATSTESFAKRRSIDRNRKMVRGYGSSQIVNEAWVKAPREDVKDIIARKSELRKERWGEAKKAPLANEAKAKREARFGASLTTQKKAPHPPKNPGIFR